MANILIVGGYGAVGSKIAAQLARRQDSTVFIGGRSVTKAQALAEQLGATARFIDLTCSKSWDGALKEIDIAIVCIDQTDTGFVLALAERGIAYVDVTADDEFFRQVEQIATPAPALLSIGLAPGLSNLLATAAAEGFEAVRRVEIGLLMGTGDEHGTAAITWSTRNMFDPKARRDDAVVDFGPQFGPRRAYFMDFADQHSLARTMPGTETITRVTYDSKLLTTALFWTGRTFAGNRTIEALVERISHLSVPGSDQCILSVTVSGTRDGKEMTRTAKFFGRKEAAVTAAVAVAATEEILAGRVPAGVHHSHQVLSAGGIFDRISQWGHGKFEIERLN